MPIWAWLQLCDICLIRLLPINLVIWRYYILHTFSSLGQHGNSANKRPHSNKTWMKILTKIWHKRQCLYDQLLSYYCDIERKKTRKKETSLIITHRDKTKRNSSPAEWGKKLIILFFIVSWAYVSGTILQFFCFFKTKWPLTRALSPFDFIFFSPNQEFLNLSQFE